MRIRQLMAILDEMDPDAEVVVDIYGHALRIVTIEEGVATAEAPAGTLYLKLGSD